MEVFRFGITITDQFAIEMDNNKKEEFWLDWIKAQYKGLVSIPLDHFKLIDLSRQKDHLYYCVLFSKIQTKPSIRFYVVDLKEITMKLISFISLCGISSAIIYTLENTLIRLFPNLADGDTELVTRKMKRDTSFRVPDFVFRSQQDQYKIANYYRLPFPEDSPFSEEIIKSTHVYVEEKIYMVELRREKSSIKDHIGDVPYVLRAILYDDLWSLYDISNATYYV